MKLTPYTKKVERYVGYQGFYSCGREKVTITVEENGIGAFIDTRSGRPGDKGLLSKYFKPMANLEDGRSYVEMEMLELPSFQLESVGFVELKVVCL